MKDLAPPSWAARLRSLTPARVGMGQTGVSQRLHDQLEFQRAHAQARDAVHARLEVAAMAEALRELCAVEVLCLHSRAADRATYLQRPDLGRQLDERSLTQLSARPAESVDLSIVIADGLSALAMERHALPLLREALPRLDGWNLAPICIVEQGRVAIGDEIGAALGARMCLVLIGERPGLSAPDSMGGYITWAPQPGRTDAERNCISNIRADGLSYTQASEQLLFYLAEGRRSQLTGVALKGNARLIGNQ
ncbi:MAG TPA: ethanolamine ammonia-lyase subunit EutC [Terracidiphilus sp.]|jgi:ethanolamine ammonia-lyase small subunit|nr:ethanolamine ammonia-lyase subunit EutC [Terracidiphilus sp.]